MGRWCIEHRQEEFRVIYCHFHKKAPRRTRTPGRPDPAAVPGPVPDPAPAPDPVAPNPFRDLLRSLRGRQVGLLLGGREVEGRLVIADPVVLVGPQGEARLVRPEHIQSVRY